MHLFPTRSPIASCSAGFALAALLFVLAAPSAAQPNVFTVGPAGNYPDLHSALNDALNHPAPNEIRVQEGPYPFAFPAEIPAGTSLGGFLSIHGGWDASFSNIVGVSIFDGGHVSQLLRTGHVDGELFLLNLVLANGRSTSGSGGALEAEVFGSGHLHLFEVTIQQSTALAPAGFARGGCAHIRAYDQAQVHLHQSRFIQCQALAQAGDGEGGALYLALDVEAHLFGWMLAIVQSHVFGSGSALGAGMFADVDGDAILAIAGTFFHDNFFDAGLLGDGSALVLRNGSSGSFGAPLAIVESSDLRRNLNLTGIPGSSQALLLPALGGTLVLRDSLVLEGDDGGVRIGHLTPGAQAGLSNLTVSGHPGTGITAFDQNDSVYNTIAFGNGTEATLAPDVATSHNLIGVDPMFIDAAAGNYSLQYLSPAIDAGNNHPPHGLSGLDAFVQTRVFNHWVDIGALEATYQPPDLIFRNGFQQL